MSDDGFEMWLLCRLLEKEEFRNRWRTAVCANFDRPTDSTATAASVENTQLIVVVDEIESTLAIAIDTYLTNAEIVLDAIGHAVTAVHGNRDASLLFSVGMSVERLAIGVDHQSTIDQLCRVGRRLLHLCRLFINRLCNPFQIVHCRHFAGVIHRLVMQWIDMGIGELNGAIAARLRSMIDRFQYVVIDGLDTMIGKWKTEMAKQTEVISSRQKVQQRKSASAAIDFNPRGYLLPMDLRRRKTSQQPTGQVRPDHARLQQTTLQQRASRIGQRWKCLLDDDNRELLLKSTVRAPTLVDPAIERLARAITDKAVDQLAINLEHIMCQSAVDTGDRR